MTLKLDDNVKIDIKSLVVSQQQLCLHPWTKNLVKKVWLFFVINSVKTFILIMYTEDFIPHNAHSWMGSSPHIWAIPLQAMGVNCILQVQSEGSLHLLFWERHEI